MIDHKNVFNLCFNFCNYTNVYIFLICLPKHGEPWRKFYVFRYLGEYSEFRVGCRTQGLKAWFQSLFKLTSYLFIHSSNGSLEGCWYFVPSPRCPYNASASILSICFCLSLLYLMKYLVFTYSFARRIYSCYLAESIYLIALLMNPALLIKAFIAGQTVAQGSRFQCRVSK